MQLNNPMTIPGNAIYATLEVVSAAIWNVSPTISEEIGNNHFYITSPESGVADFTIPDGLYGVIELEAFLQQELVNLGGSADIISLTEQGSTQKLVITLGVTGNTVDFTASDTCRDVLGFDSIAITSTVAGKVSQAITRRLSTKYLATSSRAMC